jgi:hypothetical protein
MRGEREAVMRVIAVLILGIVMYWGTPYLWTRMVVAEVNRVSADSSSFPEMNAAVATNLTFDQNVINAVNPTVTINTQEYENIAIQSQADDAMRQARAAQDQAWAATH